MTPILRRAAAVVAIAAASLLPAVGASQLPAASAATSPITGADVSWPECSRSIDRAGNPIVRDPALVKPMPGAGTKLLVIGLTNGPAFYPNPCLSSQLAWAKAHHVYTAAYAVTVPPLEAQKKQYALAGPYRSADWRNPLWNFGWAQAQFNIASMRKAGLSSPSVWIDVEFYTRTPWSTNKDANTAVVRGAYNAYRAAGYQVGFYSNGYQWRSIFGTARFGAPEWHTTGPSSLATATRECGNASFQGGRTVLSQWWIPSKDFDVVCPSFANTTSLAAYFKKY